MAVGPWDAWSLFLEVLQLLVTAWSGVDRGSERLMQGGGHDLQEKGGEIERARAGRAGGWIVMSPRMTAGGTVTAVASQELNSPKDEGEAVGMAVTTTGK